jgi:hypothetical protein
LLVLGHLLSSAIPLELVVTLLAQGSALSALQSGWRHGWLYAARVLLLARWQLMYPALPVHTWAPAVASALHPSCSTGCLARRKDQAERALMGEALAP